MAKPKLALIPAAQGDKFYSVLPSDGVGDFDFTRASTGTRIAPTGLIEEVASGDSRLNYDLLNGKVVNCPHYLLEPASTNLVTYSESMNQYTPINGTITANALTSPEGLLNAVKFAENSANNLHYFDSNSISVTSGTKYTISVFAKYNGRFLTLQGSGALNSAFATFNLQNGTVEQESVGDASIEKMPNDWYRCSIIVQMNQTGTAVMSILLNDSATGGRSRSYQGNGASGIYLYGFQTEEQSYATSYIPTNGTAITRAAESAIGSGDAATFNDSEGVLMAEFSSNNSAVGWIGLGSNSSNRLLLGVSGGNVRSYNNIGGTVINYQSTINSSSNNKISIKYKSGDTDIYINGFKLFESNSAFSVSSPFDEMQFKNLVGETQNFYGKTRELQYFDSALTDAQLETLTSWTSLQEMITSQLYTNY